MRYLAIAIFPVSCLAACAASKPGTHVELVDKGGQNLYVAGAAGPGVNKDVACRAAVRRSVAAIALKFSQEFDDIADDVAEAVGATDGQVFLRRYAEDAALDGALQDVKFNPIDHLCMATVTWTPPVFVKDAILKFAEGMRNQEIAEAEAKTDPPPAATTGPASAPASKPPAAPAASAPPPPVSVAPPPAATSAAAGAPACSREKGRLAEVLEGNQKVLSEFGECMRRTSNDENVCHRYKLYVEEAQKKEAGAGQALVDCLNAVLSSKIRLALSQSLPGHAAVSVETRANGTLVLFTFSPVDQTAFAFELAADGAEAGRNPLAANQVQWVKQQLGL